VGLVFATGEQHTSNSTMVAGEATSTGELETTSTMVVEEARDSLVSRVEQELLPATGAKEVTKQEQGSTSISRAGVRRTTELEQEATAMATEVEEQATARATGVEQEQATTKAKEVGVEEHFIQGLLVETSGEEEAGTKRKRKKKLLKVEPKQRENVETKHKGKLETKPKGKKFSLKFGPLDVSAPLARYKAMVVGKGFKCNFCDERKMSRARLETHMRMKHGEARLKCPKEGCPAEFCSSKGLSFHIANCGNMGKTYKPRAFQCPVEGCCSKFTEQANLMRHLKAQHESVRDSIASLSTHIFKRHKKGVKCGLCEEVRYTKGSMADHMRNEHGGAKMKCQADGCSLEYYSKNGLKKHMKKFHRALIQVEEFKEEAEEADEEMEQEEVLEDVAEKIVAVAGEEAV